ncbi:MAG: HAD family hydrolase [Nanoarchaeota archaeon]|nr:HAD family hydrolase [Nanoarchaeota archaeon]
MLNREAIRAVGFDLDECLYPSSPEINGRIRDQISSRILERHAELKDVKGARAYFEAQYLQLGSGRKVLIAAGYKPEEAGQMMDLAVSQADIIDLIKEDPKTAELIQRIEKSYPLTYLLTSSPGESAQNKLRAIGIDPDVFAYRICSDNCGGLSKQEGHAFRYALEKTGVPAENHVYIGNSTKSDILPARMAGMQTIGVWSNIPEADASVMHIHELEGLLL